MSLPTRGRPSERSETRPQGVIPPAKPGGPLELRAPVELFQGPIARPLLGIDQYSVTGDGQRFLFLAPRQDPSSSVSPITVLVNWTTGLGR